MTTTTQNQETQTLEEKITYFEKYDEMRNEITKMCQDLEQNLKKNEMNLLM